MEAEESKEVGSLESTSEDCNIPVKKEKDSPTSTEMETNEDNFPGILFVAIPLNIEEPLYKLRKAAEEKLEMDLSDFGIWLLNAQQLDDEKNLVEQGVAGEGMVQMHLEIKIEDDCKKINVMDVLKPAEEYVDIENESIGERSSEAEAVEVKGQDVVRWIVDAQFKKDAAKHNVPEDPSEWNTSHVRFWLRWATKKFSLSGVNPKDWNITGQDLCNMSSEEFHSKISSDAGDLFWTHLELIRKCKLVAIIQTKPEDKSGKENVVLRPGSERKSLCVRPPISSKSRFQLHKADEDCWLPSPNRNGCNGQIQLWQFLLELLTDWKHVDIIRWLGTKGEFRFVEPDEVARLWGEKKSKPTMNYEKLSRALRYYYEGDMISKVQSKRFVYKFVCNLKDIIGYDAKELCDQVTECAARNGKEIDYSADDLILS